MTTLFPDLESDLAAAIEGQEWEQRIEKVDRWLDFCALHVLARHANDLKRAKFIAIHFTLARAFEARAWEQVDAIVDAMEREFS